jgi:hypothetical protein
MGAGRDFAAGLVVVVDERAKVGDSEERGDEDEDEERARSEDSELTVSIDFKSLSVHEKRWITLGVRRTFVFIEGASLRTHGGHHANGPTAAYGFCGRAHPFLSRLGSGVTAACVRLHSK